MDDKTLIRKIKSGDRESISLLVENNKNLIWHIIISMVGKNRDNEDLFQEVFLQVFKGLRRFRSDSRLSTWIGTITHHVCVDYLRKKNKEFDLRNTDIKAELRIENTFENNWNKAEKDDLHKILLATIDKLPTAYRTAIILYHLDECSYKEISEITGMPDGTVKSYISRGRNLLKESLVSSIPDIVELLNDN